MDPNLIELIAPKLRLSLKQKNILQSSPTIISSLKILYGYAYFEETDMMREILGYLIKNGTNFDNNLISFLKKKDIETDELIELFIKYDRFDLVNNYINSWNESYDIFYEYATKFNKEDFLIHLLGKNLPITNRSYIMNCAILSNNIKIIDILISTGCNISQENAETLVLNENIEIMDYFGKGLDYNLIYSDIYQNTLSIIVYKYFTGESIKIFEYMFSHELISSLHTVKSIINCAKHTEFYEDIICLSKKYFPDLDLEKIFIQGVMNENIDLIKLLISLGVDINYNNSEALK